MIPFRTSKLWTSACSVSASPVEDFRTFRKPYSSMPRIVTFSCHFSTKTSWFLDELIKNKCIIWDISYRSIHQYWLMHPKGLIDLIEIVDSDGGLKNVRLRELRYPLMEITDRSAEKFFHGERCQCGRCSSLIDRVIQTDRWLGIRDVHAHSCGNERRSFVILSVTFVKVKPNLIEARFPAIDDVAKIPPSLAKSCPMNISLGHLMRTFNA